MWYVADFTKAQLGYQWSNNNKLSKEKHWRKPVSAGKDIILVSVVVYFPNKF